MTESGYENTCSSKDQIWIGLSDLKSSKFSWSDNSSTGYGNWCDGAKNNLEGKQHCGTISSSSTELCDGDWSDYASGDCAVGTWNDWFCDRKLRFVCKKPAEVSIGLSTTAAPKPTTESVTTPATTPSTTTRTPTRPPPPRTFPPPPPPPPTKNCGSQVLWNGYCCFPITINVNGGGGCRGCRSKRNVRVFDAGNGKRMACTIS